MTNNHRKLVFESPNITEFDFDWLVSVSGWLLLMWVSLKMIIVTPPIVIGVEPVLVPTEIPDPDVGLIQMLIIVPLSLIIPVDVDVE